VYIKDCMDNINPGKEKSAEEVSAHNKYIKE
jgi:hypothetical protein